MNSPLLGAVLVETLVAQGMTDVVLAPGSRNAPVSLALHAADQSGRLRLHVRIDERVAAFTALGLAKASGRAVAVVTTSGTAVGNLLPAAMEARASGIPLVLVTCDRPVEAVGTGASQTTDQLGLLAPAALALVRVSSDSGDERSWAATVRRAHAVASGERSRTPGPVQLNVELRGPLVAQVPRVSVAPLAVTGTASRGVAERADSLPTVVLCGDADPATGAEARALAELVGAPLLAEPSSNARIGSSAVAHPRLLLETSLGAEVQRVVCFGHPTLSRPVAKLLARPDVDLIVVSPRSEWTDAGHNAATVCDGVQLPQQEQGWLERWLEADRRLIRARQERAGEELDGHALAAAVIGAAGPEDVLFLGSSQLVRDADIAPLNEACPLVLANRGLAGIDGTVSTATGVALALGRPVTVLLGDLTLQHDLGGLVAPTLEPSADLRVVVGHDDGGAIFATLEQGAPEYAEAFERVFGTPQGVDLAAVAAALGWESATVASAAELAEALARPVRGRELLVVPLSRTHRRATEQRLRELAQDLSR